MDHFDLEVSNMQNVLIYVNNKTNTAKPRNLHILPKIVKVNISKINIFIKIKQVRKLR